MEVRLPMLLPVARRTRARGVVDGAGAGAAPHQQRCELTADRACPA